MKSIAYGDTSVKAELDDWVYLKNQNQKVVKCQETGVLMLNIDADQLAAGDLKFIKALGLTISNPDTDKPVALGVDFKEDSFGKKIKDFFESEDDDDDDSFFSPAYRSSGPSFGGFGGFGGGSSFGGFGGGGFSGGGASGRF